MHSELAMLFVKKINVSGRQIEIVTGYRNLGELSEQLKPFSFRCLKDDCLDLPEKTYMKRVIQLTEEQQKVYDQMKKLALAELNGKINHYRKCYYSNHETTSNNLWSF
jgi:SNF2 family DNA or RNA helicase